MRDGSRRPGAARVLPGPAGANVPLGRRAVGATTTGSGGSPTLGTVPGTTPAPTRGLFITLEGPDGSGKSSLLPRLVEVLAAAGCEVVATREPGSTPLGEQVRALVLDTEPRIDRTGRADALLFAASRAQHVDEVIRPALDRGAIVVCDRYADSSLAYQGAGSGVPMDELRAVQHFATAGLVPDLTILLDLPVEIGLGRKSDEITRFEAFQDVAYHERVRDAFLRFAAEEPERYAVVDAASGEDAVLAATTEAVRRIAMRMPCLAAALDRART
jgi:dTMP kinase